MKYRIIKEFVMSGIVYKEGTVVELDQVHANLKSIQDNIEKVGINPPSAPLNNPATPEPVEPLVESPNTPQEQVAPSTTTGTIPEPIETADPSNSVIPPHPPQDIPDAPDSIPGESTLPND